MACQQCEELTREVLKLYRKKEELDSELKSAWAMHEQQSKISKSLYDQQQGYIEKIHALQKELREVGE